MISSILEDINHNKSTLFICSPSTNENELISVLCHTTEAEVYSKDNEKVWIDNSINVPLIINMNNLVHNTIDMLPLLITETDRQVILIYHYYNSVNVNGINGTTRRIPHKLNYLCDSIYKIDGGDMNCLKRRYGIQYNQTVNYKLYLRLLKINKLMKK